MAGAAFAAAAFGLGSSLCRTGSSLRRLRRRHLFLFLFIFHFVLILICWCRCRLCLWTVHLGLGTSGFGCLRWGSSFFLLFLLFVILIFIHGGRRLGCSLWRCYLGWGGLSCYFWR